MSSSPSSSELGGAVLSFVEKDTYPESEEVISAELPASALPVALKLLDQARQTIRDHVRSQSQDVSVEVDPWITEARELQADIQKAEAAALDIAQLDTERRYLDEEVADVANKHGFLQKEIAFNQSLVESLETLRGHRESLNVAERALASDDIISAVERFRQAEDELGKIKNLQGTEALNLLRIRTSELRRAVEDKVGTYWDECIHFDTDEKRLSIRQGPQGHSSITIESLVAAYDQLGITPRQLQDFSRRLQKIILNHVLGLESTSTAHALAVNNDSIQLQADEEPHDVKGCIKNLRTLVTFLTAKLPSSVTLPLSKILLPNLAASLDSQWLTPAVPVKLEGLDTFQDIPTEVKSFRDELQSLGWQGEGDLTEWLENIPQVWLSKRRADSLDLVRRLMLCGLGQLKHVERTETQRVSSQDQTFARGTIDPGNAVSNNDEEHPTGNRKTAPGEAEEPDMSAWGLDENATSLGEGHNADDHNDVDEAWGFTEGAGNAPAAAAEQANAKTGDQINAKTGDQDRTRASSKAPSEREMTLREIYSISCGPEAILSLISDILRDALTLSQEPPKSPYTVIAPAATGLFSLPTLVLAMYRALSPRHYQKHPSGNMLLYNDCMWLGEQLRKLNEELAESSRASANKSTDRLKVVSDAMELELFGKSAYKKEMDSQRTQLGDLLERAKGFDNCTVEPFSTRCEDAVNGVVTHLRRLNDRWKSVLSRSVLLQSLGSLLSSVLHTIIIDIEDLSDISELESQELAKLSNRISNLEDLFLPQADPERSGEGEGPTMPLTAIYAPNWFKFQFLVNILESSLADIRYLWTEGELKLEFSTDEVIDLIEALFTDSELRRKTIAEIKRSSTTSQ